MRVHQDWTTPGFELPPKAGHVGPFPGRAFLSVWTVHRGAGWEVEIVEGLGALLALGRRQDAVRFLGDHDVTDYHTPLGQGGAGLLREYVDRLPRQIRLVLDSLPADAANEIEATLEDADLRPTIRQHEITAVVELGDGHEAWLSGLRKKYRHELRRKRRRFEAELGSPRLVRRHDAHHFAAMHRLAGGAKGEFMDDAMEGFFTALQDRVGAVVDTLEGADGRPCAMAFGFEDDTTYYLYNSAYDPSLVAVSPGIVLVDLLIRRTISSGRTRLDFLKGDEPYKFEFGAERRPLYVVETGGES